MIIWVLFAVCIFQVGQVRHMRGKNGRELQRLDVKLFDDTASTFTLVLYVSNYPRLCFQKFKT